MRKGVPNPYRVKKHRSYTIEEAARLSVATATQSTLANKGHETPLREL